LLWSDPIEEKELERDLKHFFQIEFEPNSTRGCGYYFGYKVKLSVAML